MRFVMPLGRSYDVHLAPNISYLIMERPRSTEMFYLAMDAPKLAKLVPNCQAAHGVITQRRTLFKLLWAVASIGARIMETQKDLFVGTRRLCSDLGAQQFG